MLRTLELKSIDDIRRYISHNIRYPGSAFESGQTGMVELFARVNSNGMIEEVIENQPEEVYIEIDEIVIGGFGGGTAQL